GLSESLSTVIVAVGWARTMAMPPTLRGTLARLPLGGEEKKRLEREEFEARGFLTRMERLLIAADGSPNGKFASRVAGLIAGSRGMPTTLIDVGAPVEEGVAPDDEERVRAVQAAAEAAQATSTKDNREAPNID